MVPGLRCKCYCGDFICETFTRCYPFWNVCCTIFFYQGFDLHFFIFTYKLFLSIGTLLWNVNMGIFEGIVLVIVFTEFCKGFPTSGLLIFYFFDGGLFPICIFTIKLFLIVSTFLWRFGSGFQ